eukprot:989970-Pyramimonas_sp.AAC.1
MSWGRRWFQHRQRFNLRRCLWRFACSGGQARFVKSIYVSKALAPRRSQRKRSMRIDAHVGEPHAMNG